MIVRQPIYQTVLDLIYTIGLYKIFSGGIQLKSSAQKTRNLSLK